MIIHRVDIFPIFLDSILYFLLTKVTKDSDADEQQQMTTLKSITGKPEIRTVLSCHCLQQKYWSSPWWCISQNNEKEVQGWRPVGYGGRDHIHYRPKNSEIVLAKVGIGAVHGRTLKTSCLPCWCAVAVAGIAVCVSPRTAGAAAGSLTAGGPGRSGEGEQTACAPAGDAAGVCVLKGRPVLHQPETVHGGAVLKDTSLKIIWRKKNSREEKKEEKKEGRKCLLSNADGDNDI